jgi:hypothetical protein
MNFETILTNNLVKNYANPPSIDKYYHELKEIYQFRQINFEFYLNHFIFHHKNLVRSRLNFEIPCIPESAYH